VVPSETTTARVSSSSTSKSTSMTTALEHIVGQLDLVASTMGLFEQRLAMHERKVTSMEVDLSTSLNDDDGGN
jgi:hypothetical protein